MTLVHEALIHVSDDEMAGALVPFLRDGLARDQGTVVAAGERTVGVLSAALGADADRVLFVPADFVYATPHGAINAYHGVIRKFLQEGRSGVCAVGEVKYGSTPESNADWLRYESIAHSVFEDAPLHVICPYDVRTLPASIVEHARLTHPMLVQGASRHVSDSFVEPEQMLHSLPGSSLAPASPPDFAVDELADQRLARAELERFLSARLPASRSSEALLACAELIANAARHGRGPASVAAWSRAGSVVVRVANEGPQIADPCAGYRLGTDLASGGMGLWLARQMSDEFLVESLPDGPAVTVSFHTATA